MMYRNKNLHISSEKHFMDTKRNQLKKNIDRYFGDVSHRIFFTKDRNNPVIHIEYIDFLSESHVAYSISRITGGKYQIHVVRECSDRMKAEVLATFSKPPHPAVFYKRMAEYEI